MRAAFVALAGLSVVAAVACFGEDPVFHSRVTLVKAETLVYDKHTKAPVRGLRQEDFAVFDGDQKRPIAHFGDDTGPLDLLLLLDVSGSMRDILPRVAVQAHTALEILESRDRAAVMAFGARYTLTQSLTGDFDSVVSGILRVFNARVGEDTDISVAIRGGAGYLASSGRSVKRAILIVTDNMQVTSVPDDAVERALFDGDIVLDGVLLRGLMPVPHILHPGVLKFAPKTGGEVLEGRQPGPLIAAMIERIRSRYTIHFRPYQAKSANARHIRVELTAAARNRYPDAVVRARQSYFPDSE